MGIQFDFDKLRRLITRGNPSSLNTTTKEQDTALKEVREVGEKLDVVNEQLDEILDKELETKKKHLKKKIQRKIHELDEHDVIPDDLEGPIADYAVKIAFMTMQNAFDKLLTQHVTRQKDIDINRQKDFEVMRKTISKLYTALIIALGLIMAYILPTVIRLWLESGALPFP